MDAIQTKRCSKCGEVKTVEEFGIKRSTKSGYDCRCKKCRREIQNNIYKIKKLIIEENKEKLPEGFKRCTNCNEVKLLQEFSERKKGSKDGYNSRCKICINKKRIELENKNIERRRRYQKDYRKRHPERIKESQKKQSERRTELNLKSKSSEYIDGVVKKCTKCGEIKNISEFSKDKKYIDGLDCQCKNCKNNSMKNWIINNPESYRDKRKRQQLKSKIKYHSDESIRKKRAEKDRKYKQSNAKKILERNRLYIKNNKEKIVEWRKKYEENNKEKIVEWRKKYFDDNVVVINSKQFNIKTCPEELKPAIEAALKIKKINAKIKKLKKGEPL